jgi:hypothetical protein
MSEGEGTGERCDDTTCPRLCRRLCMLSKDEGEVEGGGDEGEGMRVKVKVSK